MLTSSLFSHSFKSISQTRRYPVIPHSRNHQPAIIPHPQKNQHVIPHPPKFNQKFIPHLPKFNQNVIFPHHPLFSSYSIFRTFSTSSFQSTQFREVSATGDVENSPTPPPIGKMFFDLTENNIDEVVDSPCPVLVEAFVPGGPPQAQELSDSLRKIVSDFVGEFRLARLNVEEQQQIAEFKITHVPTVLAVIGGKIFFNRIVGFSTEKSLQKFVGSVLAYTHGRELEQILTEGDRLLEQSDIPEAAKMFNQLLVVKKFRFAEAFGLAGLVQCALKEGNLEAAQDLVKTIQTGHEETLNNPRIKQAISQVELQSMEGTANVDVSTLLDLIKQNPKDLQTRYDLGVHYQRTGHYLEAMDQMFQIIKIDREWKDQAAKQILLKIFDSLGGDNELTIKGRKRLNNIWFL